MRIVRAPLVALAALAVAAPGTAWAGWSAPAPVPGSEGTFPLLATHTGSGRLLGVFGPLALVPGRPQVPVSLGTAARDAPFGTPARLARGLGAPVATSPGGTVLAVGGVRSPLDFFMLEGAFHGRLRAGIGRDGGALRPVGLPPTDATLVLAAAVNDRGDAAVVLSRCETRGCSRRTLQAVFRRRGGRFGRPLVLTRRTGPPAAAVALGARGEALLAWTTGSDGRGLHARRREPGGRLSPVRRMGTTAQRPTVVAVLDPRGSGSVAWFGQESGEGATGGRAVVQARTVDARGRRHGLDVLAEAGPARAVEGSAIDGPRLCAVAGPDESTTYAWTTYRDGRTVVQVERLQRDVGRVETVSPPGVDARLLDLAQDAAGDVVVVWSARPPSNAAASVTAAAVRPAGASTFGASEVVDTGTEHAGTAKVALAAADRGFVVTGPEPSIGGDTPVHVVELRP